MATSPFWTTVPRGGASTRTSWEMASLCLAGSGGETSPTKDHSGERLASATIRAISGGMDPYGDPP
jgi:hypothetical protein